MPGDTASASGISENDADSGIGGRLIAPDTSIDDPGSTGRSAAQEEWERSSRAADRFQQLLLDTRAELALVYASHAGDEETREQKSAAFADLERRYDEMCRRLDGTYRLTEE